MDGVSSAAAVLQILGNSISMALRTARFVNNIRNAEDFQNDFLQGLELSQNTIKMMTAQLSTENKVQPYDQDVRAIHKLVHEIAKDCRKCHNSLIRLYNSPSNTIMKRLSGEMKREIRRPEIESVNARFRSNVGNIQALLCVLQLIANNHQMIRTKRIEERVQDIQAKLRPLQGLRAQLLASMNNLNNSQEDVERIDLSEPMSQTCNEIVLRQDARACIRITESTLETANSICEKVSSVGSIINLSFSDEMSDRADSPRDTSEIQFGPNYGTSVALSTMTTFLDTYIQELNEEFEKGSYEKCKRYIQEALDWGQYRYLEYNVDFHQWFDLQLRLAEVYEKQGNFQDARKYLIFLRKSADTNNLEYRTISNLQEVQLRCVTARLCLREYERGHNKALDELKQQAVTAFGAADVFFRDASISQGGLTLVDLPVQQLLVDSALTLDKVYVILADTAGRRSLRMGHTILRETLPQLDSTSQSTRTVKPEPPTHRPDLGMISIPDTSPPQPPSASGSSEVCTTSPLSLRTDVTRPSETPDLESAEGRQPPDLNRIRPVEAVDSVRSQFVELTRDSDVNSGTTDGDKLSKLFNAAKSHNMKVLQNDFDQFLPQINARDEAGMNVLHHVLITLGGEDDIMMLLTNGVDVNASDNHGDTPLHYCVQRNNYRAAKLLLRTKNVIVESVNNSNQTPAQLVISQSGMFHADMLRLLVKYKAKFNWPGIPRDIHNNLRTLIYEVNANHDASVGDQALQGRRDSRASESSHSSQHGRWLRAIGRSSLDT